MGPATEHILLRVPRLILVRLTAAPLLLVAMLMAMLRNLLKGLYRDVLIYPWELLSTGSIIGLGLQLLVQTWIGIWFAVLYGACLSVIAPLLCLCGCPWEKILGVLAKHRMERPLAARLVAALPVWGGSDNAKLRAFSAHRCTDVVGRLLGDSQAGTDAAMELLDEINVIKGGLFPFDQLTEVAVARAARHGVSLNAADDLGKTALHYAAERGGFWGGLPCTIAALLRGGANPNAQDLFGKTALHYAVCPEKLRPSNQRVIELLASASDADLRITDFKGKTALNATPLTKLAFRKAGTMGLWVGAFLALIHFLATTLVRWGAIDGAVEFSDLIQSGQHPWFASPKPKAFASCDSAVFWMHVGALLVVSQARRLNAEFQKCVAAFARIAGVVHKPAPVKGCDRALDKAVEYHAALGLPDTPAGGLQGVGRVVDIQRCSLCVRDAEAAVAVFAALDAATVSHDQLLPLRRKSGFAAEAEAVGGYRDVKYNMRFQSKEVPGLEGSAVVEIQIILQSYLDVKKRMHAIYRVNRGDYG
eukprot:g4124.t1